MAESKWFLKHKNNLINGGICFSILTICLSLLWSHYRSQRNDDLISILEHKLLDYRFLQRGVRKPHGKIGILAIDEKTLQKFGRFPFSRKYYEKAFDNLKKRGVEWVGFDVVWSKPEEPLLEEINPQIQNLFQLEKKDDLSQNGLKEALRNELKS